MILKLAPCSAGFNFLLFTCLFTFFVLYIMDPDVLKKPDNNDNENRCDKSSGTSPPTAFSKNQLKKQRKLAQYENTKREKRIKEKERQKQKRKELAEQGLPTRTGPSRKALKNNLKRAAEDNANSVRIAIDLDCDDLMSDRDNSKCIKQCLRIYTINRRSLRPAQLHITGIKSDGNLHKVLRKNDGWENWHLKYHFDQTHLNVFDKEHLVYLTCESDTILNCIDPKKVYVIGGLVDHNHHKNFCHERAIKANIQTARLPLSEHVDMKTRSVLSTFHVFEILVRVWEGKSWTDAILNTIPARKGAKPKLETAADLNLNVISNNDVCLDSKSENNKIVDDS